jgi:hypothetical protein
LLWHRHQRGCFCTVIAPKLAAIGNAHDGLRVFIRRCAQELPNNAWVLAMATPPGRDLSVSKRLMPAVRQTALRGFGRLLVDNPR